jgi:hypothetical protein
MSALSGFCVPDSHSLSRNRNRHLSSCYALPIAHEFSVRSSLLSPQMVAQNVVKAVQTHPLRIFLLVIANLRSAPNTLNNKRLFLFFSSFFHGSHHTLARLNVGYVRTQLHVQTALRRSSCRLAIKLFCTHPVNTLVTSALKTPPPMAS